MGAGRKEKLKSNAAYDNFAALIDCLDHGCLSDDEIDLIKSFRTDTRQIMGYPVKAYA